MTRAFLVAMLAAVLLILQPAVPQRLGDGAFSAAAWADDDDDDGGSDDDDDDGGGGGQSSRDDDDDDDDGGGGSRPSGSGGGGFLDTLFGTQRQPTAPPPAPAPPSAVPDEIVTLALDAADLATLLAQGFTVIEERPLPGVGTVSRRLRIPSDLTLADARTAARALPSGQDADFNHFYRPEQVVEGEDVCPGPDCPDSVLRDWAPRAAARHRLRPGRGDRDDRYRHQRGARGLRGGAARGDAAGSRRARALPRDPRQRPWRRCWWASRARARRALFRARALSPSMRFIAWAAMSAPMSSA